MDMAGTAVAVDIGGTFTDLAIRYPDGSTGTAKALTTPGALADGVVDALPAVGSGRRGDRRSSCTARRPG